MSAGRFVLASELRIATGDDCVSLRLPNGEELVIGCTAETVSMSRSWATVTDVAKMAGRLPLIMVLTDAPVRPRRTLCPEVQVWALRPAAEQEAAA